MGIESLLFLIPLALAVVVTFARYAGQEVTTGTFYVAGRVVPTSLVAMSAASSWIWTVALFVIPRMSYQLGLVAAIPFVLVNTGALLWFAILAPRVRAYSEGEQLTLPHYVTQRDSYATGLIYTIGVLAVQIYSVITHMLGAALILLFAGINADSTMVIAILAVAFFIVAALRGLQSSMIMDVIKYTAVFMIVVVGLVIAGKSGGVATLMESVNGIRPSTAPFVTSTMVWMFILPTSATLLSAVTMDDQLYQRAFSARGRVGRTFVLAAVFFIVIPIGMMVLGLLAANPSLGVKATATGSPPNQLIGFDTIRHLMPGLPLQLLAAGVVTALIGSGGSALHAAGNVGAKNVAQALWPRVSDDSLVSVARLTMAIVLALGMTMALVKVGIFELWMMFGTFRAVLFFPLVALVLSSVPSVLNWIKIGAVVTAATFATANLGYGYSAADASGIAILAAWATGAVLWVRYALTSRNGNAVQSA